MSIRRCGSQHFAAYNRFHNHHCHGGNFGSVFNITNKCSGGHTNFIGGFGAGLGFGLANLLGGFLGGGFNFGGFGMGGFGMGGFGFPSFGMGGFGGFGGGFGDWSMPWSSTSSSSSSKKSSSCSSGCNCKSTTETKEDKDVAELNKLRDEYNQLKDKADLTQTEIEALKKKVEEYGGDDNDGDTDGINKDANKTQRQHLLDDIDRLKPAADQSQQHPANNDGDATTPTDPTDPAATRAAKLAEHDLREESVSINGEEKNMIKLPAKPSLEALRWLASEKLPVALAHNPDAADDTWIAGIISDVKQDDGIITYTIDCLDFGEYGYKFTVVQKEADSSTFSINIHGDSEQKALDDGRGWEEQDYEYDSTLGCLKRNGAPVISVRYYDYC